MTPELCAAELERAIQSSAPPVLAVVPRSRPADATVRFMIQALEKAGCAVDRRFFSVETCEQQVVGGFRPGDGVRRRPRPPCSTPQRSLLQVVMCHNHMQSKSEFENMLVHELVHAFDHCRAADLDWGNCRHHACSEARAPRSSLRTAERARRCAPRRSRATARSAPSSCAATWPWWASTRRARGGGRS